MATGAVDGERKAVRASPRPKIRLSPVGFWSYSRRDDELSRGRLSQLRSLLLAEIQTQYGLDGIQLFQDVSAIPHGADWERITTGAIDQSTFFIPIVTPFYMQSRWCARETKMFETREHEIFEAHPDLSRDRRRIFPLLWIDVKDVEALDDEAAAALKVAQWCDFSRLRHRNLDHDEEVLAAVAAFAKSIVDVLQLKVEAPLTAEERKRLAAEEVATRRREDAARRRQEAAVAAAEAEAEAVLAEAEQVAEARRREVAEEEPREAATRQRIGVERRAERERQEARPRAGREGWRRKVFERVGDIRAWAALGLVAILLAFIFIPRLFGERAAPGPAVSSPAAVNEVSASSPLASRLDAIPQREWVSLDSAGLNRVMEWAPISELRSLAEEGRPRAQFLLGRESWSATPRRTDEAIRWYRRAVTGGDANAQVELGYLYRMGSGVERNDREGVRLYLLSAQQGNPYAQSNLGNVYRSGIGVARNYGEALSWYRRAGDQGHSDGFVGMGLMNENGEGVPRNYAQAAAWYRRAASAGNIYGQNNLGSLLYVGAQGVPQNREEGLRLITAAAAGGLEDSRSWLRSRGLPVPPTSSSQ